MPGSRYRDSQLILNRPQAYTPHDSNDCPGGVLAVMFGTDGNAVFVPWSDTAEADGTPVTLAVKAGVLYPISPKRLNATSHTAGTVVLWTR